MSKPMNKQEQEAFYAARNAASAKKRMEDYARNLEVLMGLDIVPEEDYTDVAASELAEHLGCDIDSLSFVELDNGFMPSNHTHTILIERDDDGTIYKVGMDIVDVDLIRGRSGFYRAGDKTALFVRVDGMLKRTSATWHTVNQYGVKEDGDTVLVVDADTHLLQGKHSSAIAIVAMGTYKLSEMVKPSGYDCDLGEWLAN